jgi:mRNA degradation ribonuclease J1/J2
MHHTSGHAFAADLVELAHRVNARVVVPIHTDAPEAFERNVPRAHLLADGQTLTIEEL